MSLYLCEGWINFLLVGDLFLGGGLFLRLGFRIFGKFFCLVHCPFFFSG